jgi:hypothetical protein
VFHQEGFPGGPSKVFVDEHGPEMTWFARMNLRMAGIPLARDDPEMARSVATLARLWSPFGIVPPRPVQSIWGRPSDLALMADLVHIGGIDDDVGERPLRRRLSSRRGKPELRGRVTFLFPIAYSPFTIPRFFKHIERWVNVFKSGTLHFHHVFHFHHSPVCTFAHREFLAKAWHTTKPFGEIPLKPNRKSSSHDKLNSFLICRCQSTARLRVDPARVRPFRPGWLARLGRSSSFSDAKFFFFFFVCV